MTFIRNYLIIRNLCSNEQSGLINCYFQDFIFLSVDLPKDVVLPVIKCNTLAGYRHGNYVQASHLIRLSSKRTNWDHSGTLFYDDPVPE